MSEGRARYAREGGTWIIRLDGDVRHPLSPALNALLDNVFADPDLRQVAVDLSAAETIDSTNLGVLARIANHMATHGLGKPVLIAPGRDIQTILRAVCFEQVFHIVDRSDIPEDELSDLPGVEADERAMLGLVLEAHRRLCAMSEHNESQFRDLVEALGRELRE